MNIDNFLSEKVTTCPVCECNELKPFYYYGAPFKSKVVNNICQGCGLVIQSPLPVYDSLKEYYQDYSALSQSKVVIDEKHEEFLLSIARLRYNFLYPNLNMDMNVLDVGCGPGGLLSLIKENVKSVLGINPEPSYAHFAHDHYGIEVRIGMFEEIDLPANTFDLIIFDHVFEHLHDPNSVLQKASELIRKDGLIFISTPNILKPHGFLWQNFCQDHLYTYSQNTLKRLLQKYNYEIIEFDTDGHITCENYHYPYMNLLFRHQSAINNLSAGDHPNEVLELLTAYSKEQENNRRFVNWTINMTRKLYHINSRIGSLFYYLILIIGFKWSERVYNHTLPPIRKD